MDGLGGRGTLQSRELLPGWRSSSTEGCSNARGRPERRERHD